MKTTKLKQIFASAVAVAMIAAPVAATPEITFDAGIQANATKLNKGHIVDITDVKTNIKGNITDGVDANVVLWIGKNSLNKVKSPISEAYLTFDNIVDTLIGDVLPGSEMFNFKTTFGKKAISFGTEGTQYFNETQFVGKSVLAQGITGEGQTTAEGIEVEFNLPTPMPVNLIVGAGESLKSELAGQSTTAYTYGKTITSRATTSLGMSGMDLDLGVSVLLSNLGKSANTDKNTALGVDATLRSGSYSATAELATIKVNNNKSDSYYAFTGSYDLNDAYTIAARYSGSSINALNASSGKDDKILSLLAAKKISESAKFQVQYDNAKKSQNQLSARIVVSLK